MDYISSASDQARYYYQYSYYTYLDYQRRVYEDPWFWLFLVFAIATIVILTLFLLQKYRYYTKPYVKKKPGCDGKHGSHTRNNQSHPHVTHFDAAHPSRRSRPRHGHSGGYDSDTSDESEDAWEEKYLCHRVFVLNGTEVQVGSPIYVVTWSAEGEKCPCLHVENCHGEVQTYTSTAGTDLKSCQGKGYIEPYHHVPSRDQMFDGKKCEHRSCSRCTHAHPAKVSKSQHCTVWEIPTLGKFWDSSVYVRLCLETHCLTTEWYTIYTFHCEKYQPVIISSKLWCTDPNDDDDDDEHTTGGGEGMEMAMARPQVANPILRMHCTMQPRLIWGEDDKSVWAEAVVYDALRQNNGAIGVKFELVCFRCDDEKSFDVAETKVFSGVSPSCPAHFYAHWKVDAKEFDWCFLKVFFTHPPPGHGDDADISKSNFCALLPLCVYDKEAKACSKCTRKGHYVMC